MLAQSAPDFAPHVLRAAANALGYAQRSQPMAQLDVDRIALYDPTDQLLLDETAVRNLELVTTLGGERKGSLLASVRRDQDRDGRARCSAAGCSRR